MLGSLFASEAWFFEPKPASGVLGGPEAAPPSKMHIVVDDFAALESRNLNAASEGEVLGMWSYGAITGQSLKPQALDSKAEAKVSSKYFVMPTTGLNWGKLHDNNGVDIANSCGTTVFAAADGVVIPDPDMRLNDWSGGYGKFVLIEHPNGLRTRYAHLNKISVEPGEFVSKKQKIGTMGNTGKVDGATGCHLHFEVLGGENPFAKQ